MQTVEEENLIKANFENLKHVQEVQTPENQLAVSFEWHASYIL